MDLKTPMSNDSLQGGWFAAVDWTNFAQMNFSGDGLSITIGISGLLVMIAVYPILLYLRYRVFAGSENDVEFEMAVGSLGKVTIRPNHRNVQVAHEAWVEITTRKASVPLDDENDLIGEVYDSFYSLFGELRELTRSIPAQALRNDDETLKLVETLVSILNDGLRPHLTRWRSSYNDWYSNERLKDQESPALEIQKRYPKFEDLVTELRMLQQEMHEYTVLLGKLAHGR